MPWQTRAGRARPIEHRSRAAADRAIDEARARYRHGVKALRLMRVTDPDGHLQIIDFAQELALEHPALASLAQATGERTRARAAADAADSHWRQQIRQAGQAGVTHADIAHAAGTTIAYVRTVLRRRD